MASRVRLLDLLRASARPLDARELAVSCGLHISTVRFHLQLLAEAGLVHSESDSSKTRGRPRLLYTPASAGGTTEHSGYQLLATVLAVHWADTSPADAPSRTSRSRYGHRAQTHTRTLGAHDHRRGRGPDQWPVH